MSFCRFQLCVRHKEYRKKASFECIEYIFNNTFSVENFHVSMDNITLTQWAGAVLFWICNWKQHQLAEQIANTRKGPRGLIRNYAYGICFGGWFNLVSCPHFLFEICIYLSLLLVIPSAYVYRFVTLFVCINQTFAALITHSWYHKTFPKYPKTRKALIPYVL